MFLYKFQGKKINLRYFGLCHKLKSKHDVFKISIFNNFRNITKDEKYDY